MLNYIKEKSKEYNISTLRYMSAFCDGLNSNDRHYRGTNTCSKLLRAYRDGRRYKKKFDLQTSDRYSR
jgi:hypothetical protein